MTKDTAFNFVIHEQGNQLQFTINTKVYPLEVVYKTAYFFLDKVYVFLDGNPQKEIIVVLKVKKELEELKGRKRLEEIASEFYNELLNQLLRYKVNESNAKIREYIVSKALYNAVPNEVDELLKEVEEEDWQEDPLGIAKTWEEQQEDQSKEVKGAESN